MDRSRVLTLISKTFRVDGIQQRIAEEVRRDVFCNVRSVSQSEFYAAGAAGFKPQFQVTMFEPEYNGENECELDGQRYSIYRTYRRRDDALELYIERRVGA